MDTRPAKVIKTAQGQNPEEVRSWVDGEGQLLLRAVVQEGPETLRHSLATLRKVWLEEHIQVVGLTGQQDKKHCSRQSRKIKYFGTGTQQPLLAPGSWSRRTSNVKPRLQRSMAIADGR